MARFKTFNEQEQEYWDKWQSHSITMDYRQKRHFGLHTKKAIREWCYQIGIQPGNYLFNYDKSRESIEFRFESGTDLALLKMSLL